MLCVLMRMYYVLPRVLHEKPFIEILCCLFHCAFLGTFPMIAIRIQLIEIRIHKYKERLYSSIKSTPSVLTLWYLNNKILVFNIRS